VGPWEALPQQCPELSTNSETGDGKGHDGKCRVPNVPFCNMVG